MRTAVLRRIDLRGRPGRVRSTRLKRRTGVVLPFCGREAPRAPGAEKQEEPMPELPDLVVYVDRIKALVVGQRLERIRIQTPFVLRSVSPAPDAFVGRTLTDATRLGKRIVLVFSDDLFVLVHLMIAGRLHWREPGSLFGGRKALAALDFERGSLLLTEASSKHRASLHLLEGCGGLHPFRREGVDVFSTTNVVFAEALRRRNRTLKRALTDPDIVDGVGNAYSDEILHRARLSPFRPTGTMTDSEIGVLLEAA